MMCGEGGQRSWQGLWTLAIAFLLHFSPTHRAADAVTMMLAIKVTEHRASVHLIVLFFRFYHERL